MRLLIAVMEHETNTFSPVPTPLVRFGGGRPPHRVAAAIKAYRGTGTAAGAYLDLAEKAGAAVAFPIAAHAAPSGPVEDEAFEEIAAAICVEVSKAGSTASCSICTGRW